MKDLQLNINQNSITLENGTHVMHSWEDDLMRRKAEFVCSNGGDIIEFGFGMGISASYIQQQNINSHTICEIHPDILNNLHQWKLDKKNVIILEGDWIDNIDKMSKYDGILYDTHLDYNFSYFFKELIYKISKKDTRLTWWNNYHYGHVGSGKPKNTEFEIIDVNPPPNDYFNNKQYFLPKYIFT